MYTEKFTVTLKYIKHYFNFSRLGVSDLSLDETKQYITKGGGGDTDRYRCFYKLFEVIMESREFWSNNS